MIGETAELAVILKLKDGLSPGLGRAEGQLARFNSRATQVGKGVTQVGQGLARVGLIAGAAAVAGLALAARAAGNFEEKLNIINTIAHKTPAGLSTIGDGIRKLARDTGADLTDLSDAYYDILSAGVKVADSQNTLTLAFKLSQGALSTTGEAVDFLTTAINAYGLTQRQATVTADEFAQAVADGKVKMSEIGATFANVASIAKTAGIGLDEIAASYGFITAQGVPAAEVTTEMSRAIVELMKPGKDLVKLQEKLHKNYLKLADTKGLVPALEQMRVDAAKAGIPFQNLFGRLEGYKFALQTTGPAFKAYLAEQEKIRKSNGALQKQYDERSQGLNYQLRRLKANLLDAGITAGEGLAPGLGKAADKLAAFIQNNRGEIKQFGTDLGSALNSVEWDQVLAGAKMFTVLLKQAFSILRLIPGQVDATVLGFLGLNKLSGGLIGKGIGNIIAGSLGGLGGLFSRGSPGNPMFTKEVGLPGAGGAAGGGGGSLIGNILKVALPLIAFEGVKLFKEGQDQQFAAQTSKMLADAKNQIASNPGEKTLTDALNAVNEGISKFDLGAVSDTLYGGQIEDLKKLRAMYEQALANLHGDHLNAGQSAAQRMAAYAGMRGQTEHLLPALDLLHKDFLAQRALLKEGTDAQKAAAAKAIGKDVTKGVGNLANTKDTLAQLKATRLTVTDPASQRVLDAAIRAVERKIPGREWIGRQLAQGQQIVRSNQTNGQKIAELKQIQQSLISHGDTAAASIVGALLGPVVAAIHGIPTLGVPVPGARGNVSPVNFGPTKSKVFVPRAPGPSSPTHAAGLLGFTQGATDLGIAGEAGGEAVAIVKHPHRIKQHGISGYNPYPHLTEQNRDVRQAAYRHQRMVWDAEDRFFKNIPPSKAGPVMFNPNAILDPSQVEFKRGISTFGDRDIPMWGADSKYGGSTRNYYHGQARPRNYYHGQQPLTVNVRTSTSHRDNAGAKSLHGRYGGTKSEVGAA